MAGSPILDSGEARMAEASLKSKAIRAKLLEPPRSRDYGEFTLHSTILVLDEPYLGGS